MALLGIHEAKRVALRQKAPQRVPRPLHLVRGVGVGSPPGASALVLPAEVALDPGGGARFLQDSEGRRPVVGAHLMPWELGAAADAVADHEGQHVQRLGGGLPTVVGLDRLEIAADGSGALGDLLF